MRREFSLHINYEWFSPTKPKNSTTPPCGALSSSPYHSYALHQVRINAVIGSKYECWESKEMLTRFSTEKITPFICLLQVNEKKSAEICSRSCYICYILEIKTTHIGCKIHNMKRNKGGEMYLTPTSVHN